MQVTYHSHPLYHFAGDKRPGQTTGAGLSAFGGRWYPVSANGTPVWSSMSGYGARKFERPKLAHGLLLVKGNQADDKIALRLKAGDPGIIQVTSATTARPISASSEDIARIAVDLPRW